MMDGGMMGMDQLMKLGLLLGLMQKWFKGVHWARHGNGFGKYWTQERKNASCEIMTHANGVGYNVACPEVATVIVYVKIDSPPMDQYKLDFFSSIGG